MLLRPRQGLWTVKARGKQGQRACPKHLQGVSVWVMRDDPVRQTHMGGRAT